MDVEDPEGRWAKTYGLSAEGAVLVRPDGFVAWRAVGAGTPEELARALDTVLDRRN
jgi:hypothetical protein